MVGWALDNHMRADLCVEAFNMAKSLRNPPAGLVHHSDRGVQYACDQYSALMEQNQVVRSMSRKANCWDNAVAESFFGTLEQELVKGNTWPSLSTAKRDVADYIHNFYNSARLHSANAYRSPADMESRHHMDREEAA